MSGPRGMNLVRAALGVAHLAAPGLGGRLLCGAPFGSGARAVVRVLGARQVTQAGLSWVRPSPEVLALGVEVDLAHWLSMVVLGAIRPRWRLAGMLDAVIAAGFACAGAAQARSVGGPAGGAGLGRIARLWALRDRLASELAQVVVPRCLLGALGGASSSVGATAPVA